MRLYLPVDLTGNLIMIEKLVLGEIWTGDLPIFNPDRLTSAPSRQAMSAEEESHLLVGDFEFTGFNWKELSNTARAMNWISWIL